MTQPIGRLQSLVLMCSETFMEHFPSWLVFFEFAAICVLFPWPLTLTEVGISGGADVKNTPLASHDNNTR